MLIWTLPLLQKGFKMIKKFMKKKKKGNQPKKHQMCLRDLFQKLQ